MKTCATDPRAKTRAQSYLHQILYSIAEVEGGSRHQFTSKKFAASQIAQNKALCRTWFYLLLQRAEGTEEQELAEFLKVRDKIKNWIIEDFADLDIENINCDQL